MLLTTKRFLHIASHSAVFFFSGLWLLVLLVVGTLAQPYVGLYVAEKTYFARFWFWWDVGLFAIPLPAGRAVIAVMIVGLVANLIVKTRWQWSYAGIFIAHIGGLVLLVGGALAAYVTEEGYMEILEGTARAYKEDYHRLELEIAPYASTAGNNDSRQVSDEADRQPSNQASNQIFLIDEATLRTKGRITRGALNSQAFMADAQNDEQRDEQKTQALPFAINLQAYLENTSLTRRVAPAPTTYRGFYSQFDLTAAPPETQQELNQAGLVFEVGGQMYAVFERMPITQTITHNGAQYSVALRPKRTALPFAVYLEDFITTYYPGTVNPSGYRSVVEVRDGDFAQPAHIWMNHPLRYKGYTLFQSSFVEGAREATVLTVVHNRARWIPYIACFILAFGLLLHALLRVK